MAFLQTRDGTRLFYKDWGSGKPIVFLHGWPLNADMWEYQMTYLAGQGLRCIAYDRRGFGRSDQPDHGYDYDTFADDLASVIDGLDLREVTLVGFSMGGGEVARYLSRHGAGRVARTVLVGAGLPFVLKTDENPGGTDPAFFDYMIGELMRDRPSFLVGGVPGLFGAGAPGFSVSPPFMDWVVSLALQSSPKATLDCIRAFSSNDFRGDMAAFTVPTLLIHGDQDASSPIDATARVAVGLIPGAVLKEYVGAPHGLFYTERERLNGDLLGFVNGNVG